MKLGSMVNPQIGDIVLYRMEGRDYPAVVLNPANATISVVLGVLGDEYMVIRAIYSSEPMNGAWRKRGDGE